MFIAMYQTRSIVCGYKRGVKLDEGFSSCLRDRSFSFLFLKSLYPHFPMLCCLLRLFNQILKVDRVLVFAVNFPELGDIIYLLLIFSPTCLLWTRPLSDLKWFNDLFKMLIFIEHIEFLIYRNTICILKIIAYGNN